MDNPIQFILVQEGDPVTNGVVASNLDWLKEAAVKQAKASSCKQTIYKMVPVMEFSFEVTTKVITKDLTQP